ncbi:5-nitroimidazole antibiotic resistance protein [Cucurbitaria berberidis CBS 394.84]|uniref:5-nitroimidazole antibiotic resistance protein n=1 Tax=Cucurbitaria berberidis CBS 394.84 TaxID=1168544 RepID=A0A9P4L616_9PLEO|nr:5-nitroimidazole antibiotic resistance protein [Cucurbitaria berberidis CBS 394.84]KAF1842902.1 5-nitroimidazole antibiotic resistance protein [Cucurbitaria berberidis CBS 394.84]
MASPSYPKTAVNKLGRLANRGAYDYTTVHTLINECPILHVSFNDPEHPFPVVLPMLGCTANYDDQDADPKTTEQDVYIHGYVSGRIFKSGKNAGEEGLPITIAASFLDGLVLSLTPFHNSCNYRSAILYGHAHPVTNPAEALYAMRRITNNLLPSRWENSRTPPTQAELSSTSLLKVKIASASAKVRVGGPSEDRADLKDGELVKGTWTGVVPYWGTWGEPVPGRENGCAQVETYIEEWRVRETQAAKVYAFEAVEMEGKGK